MPFHRFHLELHPDKTRLIEFGRHAVRDRRRRGEGKPESFDFLGFTHTCDRTRNGRFIVLRRTMRKRMQAKLREIARELRYRLHDPVPVVGQWLRSEVQGHFQYYAVPRNHRKPAAFKYQVYRRLWLRALRRRSQRHRLTGERMNRLARIIQCAVERRRFSVGAKPTRQLSLQPVAIGAAVEVTKPLKPSV